MSPHTFPATVEVCAYCLHNNNSNSFSNNDITLSRMRQGIKSRPRVTISFCRAKRVGARCRALISKLGAYTLPPRLAVYNIRIYCTRRVLLVLSSFIQSGRHCRCRQHSDSVIYRRSSNMYSESYDINIVRPSDNYCTRCSVIFSIIL